MSNTEPSIPSPNTEKSFDWDWNGYKAGYEARLSGLPALAMSLSAWREGWIDADTELVASEIQQRTPETAEHHLRAVGADLYAVGRKARIHEIPLHEARTRPWKLGWIDADLSLDAQP